MLVTSKINIDLRHPNPGVRVDAVQGDVNTRAVEISLFDGGAVWTVPSGVTAALAYKKPDSQQGCLDGSASVTVRGSTITIVMTKQMLAAPGTVNACVVLTDASKNQLTAFPFSVSVAANPAADVQQSDEPIKVDTSDATAAAEDIVAGKTAYVNGKKVTGTHACPGGLDTSDATAAAADILSGKTAYVKGKKVTGSIASRSAQTITPGTADQTIAAGQYLSGKQTIKGDANLVADNIKSGVSVFGVDGAYVGTVDIDTSDATATAEDISSGKTAYVNGLKVTGTHECAASEPALQSKTVSPSESQQTVSPDSGYDGLSDVTVKAVSSTYVGSGVTKKSAATYTPGKADQTIASGQYLSGKQTIKGDANLLAENIKSGVSIFGVTGTHECAASEPNLQSKTVTPSESQQTVSPDSGYDGLSSVTVEAVSSAYVGSGVTKKSAETYTPGTSDQTIAASQYLSGKQTIKGDANLIAENIKSGVSIFGVAGTLDGASSGQYAWKKYNWDNGYEVNSESLGQTAPSDRVTPGYSEYSITDDGYFVLSGGTSGNILYYYISDQTTNAETIYESARSYSLNNGWKTTYYRLTLTYTGYTSVGDFVGFVVSDNADEYPEEGSQDGFWYVKITE